MRADSSSDFDVRNREDGPLDDDDPDHRDDMLHVSKCELPTTPREIGAAGSAISTVLALLLRQTYIMILLGIGC